MIKVSNEVKATNAKDEDITIQVENHPTKEGKIILSIKGEKYIVTGQDLSAAAENASNSAFEY